MTPELSFLPTTGLSLSHTHLLALSYIYACGEKHVVCDPNKD